MTGLIGLAYGGLIWSVYMKDAHRTPPKKPGPGVLITPLPDVRITPLHDGFFMLQGSGGNVTALTGPDGILIVDTDESYMARKMLAALNSLDSGPVVRVINTHSHGDHRGGNGVFRNLGADILAHAVTQSNIQTDDFEPAGPDDVPNVVVADGHTFRFNGQDITLYHAPLAHTDGDMIVRFSPANILATGDTFINAGLPFLSRGAGATLDGHLAGQEQLLLLSDDRTVLVPGHGDVSNRAELADLHARLRSIRNYLVRLKSWGVSRRFLPLFHPVYAWPVGHRSGNGWEKFWARLAYDTLP